MIGRTVKICDFGLAKSKSVTEDDSLLRSFVGTLLYSCPEIIENRPYSEKADIWALGCIVYEMLRGHSPFSAAHNPLTVAKKIVECEYEVLNDESKDLMILVR